MGAYNSQQATFQAFLVSYLQNPTNWQNGVPRITDFSPGSVAYTWCAAVAALADMLAYAQWQTNQQALISTATGSGLDAKAADFGITRKQAVAASGIFTFGKNTPAISATDIPAGTLISTFPDANGNVVTFATNADASLPAGQTSVQVLATAQMAGSSGNLAANTPLVLSSAVPGIDTVTLTTDVANGADQEDDDSLRARTLAAFASLARGTAAWYKETALAVVGVGSATVVPQNRGPGTVDVFIVGPNNTIPDATLQAAVQAALDAGRPITDDAKEQAPTALTINAAIQVHLLPGYDPVATPAAVQAAVANYVNNLGVGAGSLGYVYALQLLSVALSVPGVANATTTFTDTAVSEYDLPQAGTLTVTTF